MRFLILALLAITSLAPAAERPNFLVIFIDDMGWGDLPSFGNKGVKTPAIDRLAKEGMCFERFYVNAPICSPSRCALITGQYPQRWKITSFLDNRAANDRRGVAQWLDPKAPSFPKMLHAAGYATGHFGKWHLGGQRDVGDAPLVSEYGFDATLTNFEGLGPRLLGLGHASADGKPVRHDLGSAKLGRGEITWVDRSKLTSGYADAALDFIKSAAEKKKPFFVNVWPDDVHSPFFPPLDQRGDEKKRTLYHSVLEAMDAQLSPLLSHIAKDPALRENTVVLLCSDNGPEPGAGTSGGFYGSKGSLFEGGIRSPLVVWAPGLMENGKAGSRDKASLLAAFDIAPSLLALAGVTTAEGYMPDGEDRSSVLLGRSSGERKDLVFWRRPPDRKNLPWNKAPQPDLAAMEKDWKLVCDFDGGRARLYDLGKDPGETRDASDDQPEVTARLKEAVLAWNKDLPKDAGQN